MHPLCHILKMWKFLIILILSVIKFQTQGRILIETCNSAHNKSTTFVILHLFVFID